MKRMKNVDVCYGEANAAGYSVGWLYKDAFKHFHSWSKCYEYNRPTASMLIIKLLIILSSWNIAYCISHRSYFFQNGLHHKSTQRNKMRYMAVPGSSCTFGITNVKTDAG